MTVPGGFTAGTALPASDMNLLPGGIVAVTSGGTSGRGYRTGLAAQTVNAGITADITNSSMTFTGVAGRLYRYQCIAYGASTSASGLASLNVTDGSNNVLYIGWANLTNSSGVGTFVASYVFTATGSTTVKLRMNSVTGNNTIFNASSLGAITLEDIGKA